MSNEVTVIDPKTIPAHLRNKSEARKALDTAILAGAGGPTFPRISIRGARFRIVIDKEETVLEDTKLRAIVVGANPKLSKTWYEKPWTPDSEPVAPDCFSIDGIRPHAEASNPQNDLCATCPKNAFGSATNAMGNPVKACSDQKRVAIVAADAPDGDAYLLQITPAAISSFNKYVRELARAGLSISEVVTQISFDPKASFPKLMFRFADYVDEATDQIVLSRLETSEIMEITGQLTTEVVTPPAESTPKRASPVKPKAVEADVEDAEEVEPETPPAKTAAFGAKPAAKAEEPVESKPAPKKAAAKAPAKKPAPQEVDATDDLAQEIGDMLEGLDLDDE